MANTQAYFLHFLLSSAVDAVGIIQEHFIPEMAGYDYRQKLGQTYDGAAIMYKNITTD